MPRSDIPVHHSGQQQPPAPGNSSSSSSSSSTPSSGGSGGGGVNSYGSMWAAQQRQLHQQQHRSSQRYLQAAHTLQMQLESRLAELGGYRKGLDKALEGALTNFQSADGTFMKSYRAQAGDLERAADDNVKAADGNLYANLANRGRERANALSEAVMNGAGESDMLRAQSMALNNWEANQSETLQAFNDSRTAGIAEMTQLTEGIRNARVENKLKYEADVGSLWRDYYDRKSNMMNEISNFYGEMANAYGNANEMQPSKKTRRKQREANQAMADMSSAAVALSTKTYESKGAGKLLKWDGQQLPDTDLGGGNLGASATSVAPAKPEGASLRSWS